MNALRHQDTVLPTADHHTAAWPALTLCVVYGPALALGAWLAWRVVRGMRGG